VEGKPILLGLKENWKKGDGVENNSQEKAMSRGGQLVGRANEGTGLRTASRENGRLNLSLGESVGHGSEKIPKKREIREEPAGRQKISAALNVRPIAKGEEKKGRLTRKVSTHPYELKR